MFKKLVLALTILFLFATVSFAAPGPEKSKKGHKPTVTKVVHKDENTVTTNTDNGLQSTVTMDIKLSNIVTGKECTSLISNSVQDPKWIVEDRQWDHNLIVRDQD